MHTLFVTMMAYPPIGGEFLRNWQNINLMRQFGPVGVFSMLDRPNQYVPDGALAFWQHYDTSMSPGPVSERVGQWLRQRGVSYYCAYRRSAAQQLHQILAEFQPQVVVIEQVWLYYYLSVVQPYPGQIIFDNHNIEAPLYARTKCAGQSVRSQARRAIQVPQLDRHERTLVTQAHQTWVCSQLDAQQLTALYGAPEKTVVVPNAIQLEDYNRVRQQRRGRTPAAAPKILYMGNFGYIPNAEAAQILIGEIYPRLRIQAPDAQLLLVGRCPPSWMQQLARQNPNITVTGEVSDVRPYLATADVMVVPLHQGSGTRFKVLEAFSAGCPVISTAKGVEGLNVQDGEHCLVREHPEEMVAAIGQISGNPWLAHALTVKAYEQVLSQYSWTALERVVADAIAQLIPTLTPV
ncbi:MAG: glycosyltransferase family 4 protein [Cyanobacteria bacterium P01_F01_bin.4]